METKNNKALLLSGAVLFSVMGGIEKANSAEMQNEMNVINMNIINDEKPIVTTNVEKNKAPRMDDEIKKRTEELLGGGKNVDIPDDGREYVVVNRCQRLRTEKDIDNELRDAVDMAEKQKPSPRFHNENMRNYFEGETVLRDVADVLGLKGEPYVRPENKDKKLDNREDVKEEQDESYRIEKSDSNVDVNLQECKLDFPELKEEEEDKKQDEKTELNNAAINYTNNEGNDFNINNEKHEPEVQNNVGIVLEIKTPLTNSTPHDEDSNENEPKMSREMLQYGGEKKNDDAINNNREQNKLEASVKGHEFPGDELYKKISGTKVDERIAANLRTVNDIHTVDTKQSGHSIVIDKAPQQTWFQQAVTTVKSGLSKAWSSVKRGFSLGWNKVKSVFKWK